MIEFGFEQEFFVIANNGTLIVAADAGLPHDGCGYLAESRGEHHSDPIMAAYLLRAETHKLVNKIPQGSSLSMESTKIDKSIEHDCLRRFGKSVQSDFSLSGKWCKKNVKHAGLHVHFSNNETIETKEGQRRKIAKFFNATRIIHLLDQMFAPEIKASGRATGLYKMKDYGFEYRSLPSSLDAIVVAEFMTEKKFSSLS